ncbi:hypothetical protein ANO11243_079060 [Dothideomycetidae sp. 11243]|nr:hypothetical protein ANO11243_079060 [fungal sp. No.11243]
MRFLSLLCLVSCAYSFPEHHYQHNHISDSTLFRRSADNALANNRVDTKAADATQLEQEAERQARSMQTILGPQLASVVAADLAKRMNRTEGVRSLTELISQAPQAWFQEDIPESSGARDRGKAIKSIADFLGYTVSSLVTPDEVLVMAVLAPISIIVEAVLGPMALAEIVMAGTPWKWGKCLTGSNVCVADKDGQHHPCELKYGPCKRDNEKCGYRHIHPAKVVCDWFEVTTWVQAGSLSPLQMSRLAGKAEKHREKYNQASTELQSLKNQEMQNCQAQSDDSSLCSTAQEKIRKCETEMAKHAPYMDMTKSPELAKKASRLWDKAIDTCKKQKQEYDEQNVLAQAVADAGGHKRKKLEKKLKAIDRDEAKTRQDLLALIKKAQQAMYQADPVGMMKMWVDRALVATNGTGH